MTETLLDFARSLNYGSRTDVNFKWLAQLGEDGVPAFLTDLFREVMRAVDSGDATALGRLVQAAQVAAYRPDGPDGPGEPAPVAPSPARDPARTRLAVVSSSGHFVADEDPAPLGVVGMTPAEARERVTDFLRAAPVLSEIPVTTPDDELAAVHPGYDPEPAALDPGVVLPLRALRELAEEGRIGHLVDPAFSFIGAASRTRMRTETAPSWAASLADRGVEAALLVAVCPVCHITTGHLAQALEARGITTVVVVIEAFAHVADGLGLPRVLVTRQPLGRTVGAPHDVQGQRATVEAALALLASDAPARRVLDVARSRD